MFSSGVCASTGTWAPGGGVVLVLGLGIEPGSQLQHYNFRKILTFL